MQAHRILPPMSLAFRLGFVSVHVDDMARARPFYEKVLGLRVVQEVDANEVFYDLGGTPLSVHVDKDRTCGRAPGGATGFYLQVEDAGAARRAIVAEGGRVAWEDGPRMFSVEDPEGNEYVLWQPRAKWPPG